MEEFGIVPVLQTRVVAGVKASEPLSPQAEAYLKAHAVKPLKDAIANGTQETSFLPLTGQYWQTRLGAVEAYLKAQGVSTVSAAHVRNSSDVIRVYPKIRTRKPKA